MKESKNVKQTEIRATQAAAPDICKAFYSVWHTGLLYKFRLNVVMKMRFIFISFHSGKRS